MRLTSRGVVSFCKMEMFGYHQTVWLKQNNYYCLIHMCVSIVVFPGYSIVVKVCSEILIVVFYVNTVVDRSL